MTQAVANGAAGAVDFFKSERPDAAFTGMKEESLADGIGQSYAVIGYKGKIFSLRVRGENKIFLRPDDGTPAPYIDVVILRQAPVKSKSFYPDGFDEAGSAGKRPTCASIDGVRPDPEISEPQSKLCALCPKNEWKTDSTGRRSRECQDYKRLAVLVMPNQTVRLLGAALLEPVFLRIPPASLNALATFGENAAQNGWHYSAFVTRVMFDPTKSHPEFTFKPVQKLSPQEASVVVGLRDELLARRVTGEDEIERRALTALPPPTNAQAAAAVQAAAAQAPLPSAPPAVPAAPPPLPSAPPTLPSAPAIQVDALPNPGLGAFLTPPPGAPPPPPPALDMVAQGGGAFGLTAPPEPSATPPAAPLGQTADDVGAAIEDPDLDARIMAMMKP
jgi:hypothetical protein